jgi:hypothetical protein
MLGYTDGHARTGHISDFVWSVIAEAELVPDVVRRLRRHY